MSSGSLAAPADTVFTVPDAVLLRAISRRFGGRWLQGYAHGKLRGDPVYAAVAGEISAHPAPILDVGCGIGLLAHYLQACHCLAAYRGVDIDADKIRSARLAMAGANGARFDEGACEALPPWRGYVVILDVLHYLEAGTQHDLLRSAAERVSPGAALIIRTVVRDRSWRFAVTRAEEVLIRRSRWIRYGVRHYPALTSLRDTLAGTGLNVDATPLFGRTPFNSYLLIARRPAMAA